MRFPGRRQGRAKDPALTDAITYELASFDRKLANGLSWFLEDNKISRDDLAGRLGISPSRMSSLMHDGNPHTLVAIAAAAGATVKVTLGDSGHGHGS
jgi:transcriptional regulator with XRE-family HTH domain